MCIYRDFDEAVNMSASELRRWLGTRESRSVGQVAEDGDHSGRRVVDLLQKRVSDLTESDTQTMRGIVGYVHRHLAQKPGGDVARSRWRYSLMNRGHDPLRD
ncbi:DUF3140 domain-containing protein [Umezawaea beigongshangensis]|uniref:DUF3140 domain-containing protein n=1 Tax=Umezawaea beigongshangensis TaxID=2780383 RepID=UPI0018F1ACDE|nr:DUF3140 domain-containing protein [Umezawaea beigongshangensis]